MFHNQEAARGARFQENRAGRMIAKGMSQSGAIVLTTAHERFTIQGHVSPGFEAVREAFAENFVRRRELGGACCAFHAARRSSTRGAVSETSRRVSLGRRTPWSSSLLLQEVRGHHWRVGTVADRPQTVMSNLCHAMAGRQAPGCQ
jgi:hypothetical protein